MRIICEPVVISIFVPPPDAIEKLPSALLTICIVASVSVPVPVFVTVKFWKSSLPSLTFPKSFDVGVIENTGLSIPSPRTLAFRVYES